MRADDIFIMVFEVENDGTFESIGQVNMFENLVWPDKYVGTATFELWAPITAENNDLLRAGNILWTGGKNGGIIEIIKPSLNREGKLVYDIKGRTLECMVAESIVWGTYNAVNKHASSVMYDLVKTNCVSPLDVKRKVPFLSCAVDSGFGPIINKQVTGGDVYETLVQIANETGLGFDVVFDPIGKSIVFTVTEGRDRTIHQSVLEKVEFSSDLEDILESTYYYNDQDERNVALVAGEGEGADRVMVTTGDLTVTGFDRKELFVDARDIQTESVDEEGNTITLTPGEYQLMLIQRGNEQLAEHYVSQTYEGKVRTYGSVQFIYGIDYNKGDKVTVTDKHLGIQIDAVIEEVEEGFEGGTGYFFNLIFGFQYPTILQRIKMG